VRGFFAWFCLFKTLAACSFLFRAVSDFASFDDFDA
jgi:hypothetical protein